MWKLLFRGRLKRLRGVEQAAAMMAAGKLAEASDWLKRFEPRVFLEDVSVYHFVAGRIEMEKGNLQEAEAHLLTAGKLGLATPSLGLLLAVLKARQGESAQARALLSDASGPTDPGVEEQIAAVRKAVDEVLSGTALRKWRKQAIDFARDALSTALPQGADARGVLDKLQAHLKDRRGERDTSVPAGAAAVLGEVLVQCCRAAWQLGLEASDHRVIVKGVPLSPYGLLDDFLAERISSLGSLVDDPLRFVAGVGGSNNAR